MSRMVSLGGFVLDGGRSQQPGNKKKILCKISLEIDCSEVNGIDRLKEINCSDHM